MVNEISTLKEFKLAIGNQDTGLVIIDFYTSWCGPCHKIVPIVESLSKKYPETQFYKINAENDQMTEICKICQINNVPTFCFFYGGKYFTKLIGADMKNLESMIKTYQSQKPMTS